MAESGPAPFEFPTITAVDDLPSADPGETTTTATSDGRFPFVIADRYVAERELGRGMARVFLAEDRRLKRRVAVKVVVARRNPRGVERLEQEARLIASLGHPNILQVHDVGRLEDGSYLVEEYLDGRTVRTMLRAETIPVATALDLAAQAARGLAAAHERGVVHRDLKPENLFVTAKGQLKILDFGIATLQPARAQANAIDEPVPASSAERGFAGTPPYSSPEQIRCAPMDHRSDLFSLGVVLYEILAGKRPYDGENIEVACAILTSPPRPLPKRIPIEVQRIVERCLEKDPKERFQSAPDLAAALEAAAARIRARIWPRRVAVAAAILLAMTGAVLAWARSRSPELVSYRQMTFLPGAVWTARFAADGKTVFYTEAFDGQAPRIFSTRVGSPDYQRLEVQDAVLLGVSPRNDLAVLRHPVQRGFGFSGTLAAVSESRGEPRDLLASVDDADWAPTGEGLAVVRRVGDGSQLEYPVGSVLFRTPGWISDPRVSRDGERVAFVHHPEFADDGGDLDVVDRSGGLNVVSAGWGSASGVTWSPDGNELWFGGTGAPGIPRGTPLAIRAVAMNGAQRELARGAGHLEILDASPEGRVIAILPRRILGIAVSDASGERDLSVRDEQVLHDLAADGSRVLFTTSPRAPSGEGAIFVRAADGAGAPVQIATGYGGALSPDGKHALIFPMSGSKRPLTIVAIGPGEPRLLRTTTLFVSRGRFVSDGVRVLLVGNEEGHTTRLWLLSLPDERLTPISEEGIAAPNVAVSREAAAALDARGVLKLYPLDGGPARPVSEAAAGESPYGFGSDGALLLGHQTEGGLELDRLDLRTHRRAHWRTIRPLSPGASIRRVLFSYREEVVAYSHESWKTHLYLLEGVK